MAYLMHIGFDNSSRLCRRVYYFKYKEIKFKLIQTESKWRDVLLTVTNDSKTKISPEKAFNSASEFLTALSWQNNSLVKFGHAGGPGVPEGYPLKKAKCRAFTFPEAPFIGRTVGYNLSILPEIETEEQKVALILFREARSSNNPYLSFLFYWQVLEVRRRDPIGWINKIFAKKRHKVYVTDEDLKVLGLGTKKLGNYFYDDRRNAIAHINTRCPGKAVLKFDTFEESHKAYASKHIMEEFARLFIRDELKLDKSLYLVRSKKDGGFPTYVDNAFLRQHGGKKAYPDSPMSSIKKHRSYY
jgi:hypothetical protein